MAGSKLKRTDTYEEDLLGNEARERLVLGGERVPTRTHYRLVSAPIHQLEQALSKWLADGWQPLGGPSIDARDGTMHQAITKRS